MTHSISVFSEIDKDTEWRRALAKVYSLLVKLAEEAQGKNLHPVTAVVEVVEEESINESEFVQLELMM